MTAPVPFPLRTGGVEPEPIMVIPFGEWDANGWTKSGDNEIIDWWDDPAPVGSAYVHGNNGLGTWFDGLPPPRRDTQIAKTFGPADGFVANRRYRFVVEARWQLGTGGDAASFTGTEINGVRGSLPGPIFEAETRTYEIRARADASGNVEIKALLESIPTSSTWDANWYEITVFEDFEPGDLADIIINSASIIANGAAISITRQGARFDPQEEWEDYEFPGQTAPVDGLRELVGMKPVVRAVVMMTGESQIDAYRPGGTWDDHATIEGARTFTPAPMRAPLSSEVSLRDFICTWKRQRGDYIAVHGPRVLCRRYDIHGADKNEGELAVEFEFVQDLSGASATPKGTPVYYLHTLPADYTIEDGI